MYKNIIIILIAALFVAVPAFSQKAEIDKPAPNFTLTDSEGNIHSLAQYKGKYVILEWINFGCPFVVKHYATENMQALQEKYTGQDVVWLTICSSAPGKQGNLTNDEINKALKDQNAAMTAYLIDDEGTAGKLYGAKTTPDIRIIDPNGVLIYVGAIDDKPTTSHDDVKGAFNYIDAVFKAVHIGGGIDPKVTKPYGCSVKY